MDLTIKRHLYAEETVTVRLEPHRSDSWKVYAADGTYLGIVGRYTGSIDRKTGPGNRLRVPGKRRTLWDARGPEEDARRIGRIVSRAEAIRWLL